MTKLLTDEDIRALRLDSGAWFSVHPEDGPEYMIPTDAVLATIDAAHARITALEGEMRRVQGKHDAMVGALRQLQEDVEVQKNKHGRLRAAVRRALDTEDGE